MCVYFHIICLIFWGRSFYIFFFHSMYFKFIYVNILVWFVVLVFVSDKGVKPKAHVFCFVLYILELHTTYFCFLLSGRGRHFNVLVSFHSSFALLIGNKELVFFSNVLK